MKLLHVVSPDGKKLFSGSRHDCKQFVRKNRINRYHFKERFIEKVAVVPDIDLDKYFSDE